MFNLGALFHKKQAEQEMDDELRFHLEKQVEQNIARGMTPEEARYTALRQFGNVGAVKEDCRDAWGIRIVNELLQDLRYGLRQLRRNPGFTAVAVLTLALGIGANTAIFSVVDSVLLAPLPYPRSNRLVVIWETLPRSGGTATISYPNFLDWQRGARLFERMAGYGWSDYELTSPGPPAHVWGMEVSSGFFSTLGTQLALGREFTAEEDQPGGARVAIISNRMWRNRFAGSPQALGKVLALNGVDRTIVGVAPPRFNLYGYAAYWPNVYTPLGQRSPALLTQRGSHTGLLSVARLRHGVNLAEAQGEMSAIQVHLDQLYPDSDRGLGAKLVPLKQEVAGDVSGMLLLLFGAVGLVLLIACANVANLLLARSAARAREFAIRSALGAGRRRMVRQLLTESTLLAVTGGALGLLFAAWGVKPVLAILPVRLPRSYEIGVNFPVLLFAFGIAVAVGILFGLVPALKSSNSSLGAALKEAGRTPSGGRHRAQNTLVLFQMALTVVLLTAAGLLLQRIRQLWNTDPGFDPHHVVTFNVGFSSSASKTGAGTRHAYQQLLARIRQIPGVESAGLTFDLPLTGDDNITPFWMGNQRPAATQAAPRMMVFDTDPEYLRVMKIPLLRGRFFTPQDNLKSPCVAAIDSNFAKKFFRNKDPLGQNLTFGWTPPTPCTIVGVVGHVRSSGLSVPGSYMPDQGYFPLYQVPNEYWTEGHLGSMAVIVRTSLSPATVMPEIRKVVYGTDKHQTVYDVQTMEQLLSDSMWQQRFPMILLGTFAGLALLLASVGIYGVVSYSVTQRVQEIGIRMALGAQKQDVLRMVISQGVRLALAGLTVGLAAALILTRVLSSFSDLIYGVRPTDPMTFTAVALILIGVALLACYIPARRAAKVDPMVALRYE
ncbi:MAG TPA: ABC transporter permease [Terriglobia bacterium]|nr:ABC transporter permease [Terriglobia bacterium]